MPQNVLMQTLPREWDFLEPAMNPNLARTKHVKLALAGAGLFVAYASGQVIAGKDDGTNEYAKLGTAGYTLAPKIIKYPVIVNEFGFSQYGDTWAGGHPTEEGTVAVYYVGIFKCQDLLPAGLVDAATQASIGRLIEGTRTTGLIYLGV